LAIQSVRQGSGGYFPRKRHREAYGSVTARSTRRTSCRTGIRGASRWCRTGWRCASCITRRSTGTSWACAGPDGGAASGRSPRAGRADACARLLLPRDPALRPNREFVEERYGMFRKAR